MTISFHESRHITHQCKYVNASKSSNYETRVKIIYCEGISTDQRYVV